MTSNLYKRLRNIIPEPRLLVGAVISTSEGTARIQLPDGSIVQARGEAAIGQNVYLRDGVIEGEAPALPAVQITV
jgi:hypothetical protein